jgi:hypothetical protein
MTEDNHTPPDEPAGAFIEEIRQRLESDAPLRQAVGQAMAAAQRAGEELPVEDLFIGLALAGLCAGYALRDGIKEPGMHEVIAREAVHLGRLALHASEE